MADFLGYPGGPACCGNVRAAYVASGSCPIPDRVIGRKPVAGRNANGNGTGGRAQSGTVRIPVMTRIRGC